MPSQYCLSKCDAFLDVPEDFSSVLSITKRHLFRNKYASGIEADLLDTVWRGGRLHKAVVGGKDCRKLAGGLKNPSFESVGWETDGEALSRGEQRSKVV